MLQEFINYLQQQVDNHSIYLWGGQGEDLSKLTDAYIRQHEKIASNVERVIALRDKRVKEGYKNLRAYDCSGLGMYYLYNISKLLPSDTNADGMLKKCAKIDKNSLRKGDWVFRCYSNGQAYHIGYVVDEALNVIEAKGRDEGVVKRSINAGGTGYWNVFGRPTIFKNEIESNEKKEGKIMIELTQLKKGSKGAEVKTVQRILKALGYNVGGTGVDGDFGANTESAVKKFQKDKGLTADGIVGANTWTKLLK